MGGYKSLLVYRIATDIYDLTSRFCERFIPRTSRTFDQMVQAARSGKQNIVEGSLEKSIEGNLKLTGIARASFGELLEDYRDYLRQKKLLEWNKNDPRVLDIRKMTYKTYETNKTNKSNESYLKNPEAFANLLITLCYIESYLLDRLLAAVRQKFVKEGGFRENLFKERQKFIKSNRSY